MTDDTCGAETGDGGECQNPPSEGDRCWIPSHSDPAADNPQGRPFSITEDDHEAILDAARLGKSKRGCARSAGVDKDALNRYLEARPKFRDAFARARARGEDALIVDGLRDPDVDSSMARFLLSTSFDYVKTERRELTGEDGGAVEVNFSEEIVETPWGDGE